MFHETLQNLALDMAICMAMMSVPVILGLGLAAVANLLFPKIPKKLT